MSWEREVSELKESSIRMEASIKRIETAIAGDEKMGATGLVHHQKLHNERIKALEEYKTKQNIRNAKIIGAAAVLGTGTGFAGHGLWGLIAKFWE